MMTAHLALRSARWAALALIVSVLGWWAVEAATALDRRFLGTRYIPQDLGRCWIQEWRPFELYLMCPSDCGS